MLLRSEHRVDTLTLLDRLAVRTNALDWLLMVPNIGVEFDVKGRNWNRWTVGASIRGNWQTAHTYKPERVYNLREVRLEGRQYWRTRDMGYVEETGEYSTLQPHKHIWDRAVSIRRKRSKFPMFTFFRGIYATYGDYSLKLFDTGYQGSALQAGFTWGAVTNLYGFQNGNSLDLELGISIGGMYTKNTKYGYDAESDCYPIQKINDWHFVIHPVPNDISVTLVYRLGKYPSLWKYRYRDDVDYPYADAKRDRRLAHESDRKNTKNYNEVKDSISREFWHVYDEYVAKHKKNTMEERLKADEQRRQQKADERAAKEQAKKEKKQEQKPQDGEAEEPQNTGEPQAAEEPQTEGKEGGDE